jgi:hypothetical protein
VGESATYFSRPTPTLAFANGSLPVSSPGILAAANLFIHCPKILWLAISPKAGIDSFPTLYRKMTHLGDATSKGLVYDVC